MPVVMWSVNGSPPRHQWGSHRSVVWAKSPVFPRIHLPSGVHGHPGGRYEWWEVTWTENKVTRNIWQLIWNLTYFSILVLRSPKQCQKRCQDTKGCNFFAWDRGLCTNDRISWPSTFIIYLFLQFFLSHRPPCHYWLLPVHRLLLAEEIRRPENSSSQDNYWTKILCPNRRNYSHRRSICSRTLRCHSIARTGSVHKSLINPRTSVYLGYSCWF